jgi:cellulose synthase/poly-beta-1,6-N-acetylglucosamine synthase-like glycosyltransferase
MKRVGHTYKKAKRIGAELLARPHPQRREYLRSRAASFFERRRYRQWFEAHRMTDDERTKIREVIRGWTEPPLISVILPVFNIDEKWLRACIDSVRAQVYENWELCIADDASTRPHVRGVLEEFATQDPRIKVVLRTTNGHISAASNSALELTTGVFSVLLDHDDELAEDALFRVAEVLIEQPDVAMVYSDEDVIDERGVHSDPKFKPDFALDLMYSLNLVTHLSAYRTDLLREIGGFRIGLEGSQDYDLALRVIERIRPDQIRHIPRVLYHWRAVPGSVASGGDAKPYAFDKARDALTQHFERTGVDAEAVPAIHNLNRVRYRVSGPPRVSLILFACVSGADTSLDAILDTTEYIDLQVIRTTGSSPRDLNARAQEAEGEVVCFLDASLCPVTKDWLRELVGPAMQEEIGCVGGRIESATGRARQVGYVLAEPGVARPTDALASIYDAGYFFRAGLIGNFSAVSIRCMALKRSLLEDAGGFDDRFATLYDADLCLRLAEKGRRTVYTPYARFTEAAPNEPPKASVEESVLFKQRWAAYVRRDPFYNPNLSTKQLFRIR